MSTIGRLFRSPSPQPQTIIPPPAPTPPPPMPDPSNPVLLEDARKRAARASGGRRATILTSDGDRGGGSGAYTGSKLGG